MQTVNPFEFKYPDDIEPNDVIDLFVPVFGEYYNVPVSGHTFINGARGSGKSMMFRYMKPDCQVLVNNNGKKLLKARKIEALDYFGIYVPIKKGHLNKTDILLNENHGVALLNEHYMVIHFAQYIFKEISGTGFSNSAVNKKALSLFHNNVFNKHLKYAGFDNKSITQEIDDISVIFDKILDTLKEISSDFQNNYIKELIGTTSPLPYKGPLLLYADFLFEILREFRKLPFMPKKPIYLLIDDADELSPIQRKILNSWVAMRTSTDISLKISTQLKYKIFSTINGSRIDTPHDYSEVNINDIYTTKKDIYYKRVEEIVTKRLNKFNFKVTLPEKFFPPDAKQDKDIKNLREKYIKEQKQKGKTASQANDFAYRYTVPDFIKALGGNRYTYSYAGFGQLVNISSGIIREFIDFASEMYVSQKSLNGDKPVEVISDSIQNKVIRKYSDNKMESEFDKARNESVNKNDMDKLRNLILGMGGLYSTILISQASERRVFSIALNDEPDEELKGILDLGVQLGYLQKSMIGNKEGTGKSRLYILNRVLAPHFGLDPTSFAGYKFMNSAELKRALVDYKRFIENLKINIKGADSDMPSLFDNKEFENKE